ncbi:hypothetical protein BC6307_15540 [Sutcliffiella cohnii]|uniref:Uncharacterized protein n=1 Tax=Sutcliffiella cohnii TaxID=33932 RepID=A0A223KTF2_9BACI|nr:hypothetical protein [Sutcliffiella cohnii]AST92603.1 hypothetical protein BC6307_15540 [Sutcliffiella cohnii]
MRDQRKSIIINEIKYWKQNRLLPEQYCNYLLALYSEGTEIDNTITQKASKLRGNIALRLFGLFLPLLVPFTFLVIYFTELSSQLQMVILSIFIVIAFLGLTLFSKEGHFIHIPVIVLILLLLVFSVTLAEMVNVGPRFFTILVAFQALVWLLIGIWKRWYYLHVVSIFTFLVIILFIILQ